MLNFLAPTVVESDPGKPNFLRWTLLKTPWLKVYLHRFIGPDHFDLHNHDYDSASILLWKPYRERITRIGACVVTEHLRRPWRWYWRPAEVFHHVAVDPENLGKVWTLFFRFERRPEDLPPCGYLITPLSSASWRAASYAVPLQGVCERFIPLAAYDRARGYRRG